MLYPKKLNGIRDLQREKELLKKQREELSVQHFLSDKNNMLQAALPDNKFGRILSAIVSTLGTETIMAIIFNTIPALAKSYVGKKAQKSFSTIAGSILNGFIKWEAIDLGLRGLKLFLRMQKNKKAKQSA